MALSACKIGIAVFGLAVFAALIVALRHRAPQLFQGSTRDAYVADMKGDLLSMYTRDAYVANARGEVDMCSLTPLLQNLRPSLNKESRFHREKLWDSLLRAYDEKTALSVMPRSWLWPRDKKQFLETASNTTKFVTKNINSVGAKGVAVKFGRDIKQTLDNGDVIQEFVPPHTFNSFLYVLRVWLILDCDQGWFMETNGIIKPARKPYVHGSLSRDSNLVGTVSGEEFYRVHKLPKNMDEAIRLDPRFVSVRLELARSLQLILRAYPDISFYRSCDANKAHAYGPDVIIDEQLRPRILEINTCTTLFHGPDRPEYSWHDACILPVLNAMQTHTYPAQDFIHLGKFH